MCGAASRVRAESGFGSWKTEQSSDERAVLEFGELRKH